MINLRKVVLIFVIAVLYAVLANAIMDAFYPAPDYSDYCKNKFYPEATYKSPEKIECAKYNEPTREELDKCANDKGMPDYNYGSNGCIASYKGCNFCQRDFDNANRQYNFSIFIFSSVLALIAIVVGLLLSTSNALNEWIATGFLLGGLITLFAGTFRYYQYLGRYIKPLVILAELIIVIFLSYKKLQEIKPVSNKRKRK